MSTPERINGLSRPARSSGSMIRVNSDAARLIAGLALIGAVTAVLGWWLRVSNAATVSTTYLMVVLVVAATSKLWVAVATSLVAMLCLNFFFLPPVGAFTIADPQNWVALFAFLAVSLVASNLSAIARTRTAEAVGRRDELARLFDLSRDVLMMTDSHQALTVLARSVARRFDLTFVAVAVPRGETWDVNEAGDHTVDLDRRQLAGAFAAAQASLEFDAHARTYAGHRTTTVDGQTVRLVPLRVGTKPIGILAAAGRPVEAGTLDTLAGVVAIAIERAHLLEERKSGELTRQSEQLKTALLASIGHDLRTPLTAIRVAASNIESSALSPEERVEQSGLILSEVERLTRLFENILEMARIDTGAIAAESRWTHPSEIIAAARDQVEHTVRGRTRLTLRSSRDVPVRLDPRLTAKRAGAPAGECRSVHAARIADRHQRASLERRIGHHRFATMVPASRQPICRICSSGSIAATRQEHAPPEPGWACGSSADCWPSNRGGSGRKMSRGRGPVYHRRCPSR